MNDHESLEQLVTRINGIYAPEAEVSAGAYAFEAAEEAGYGFGDAELEVHLETLRNAGANFDFEKSLAIAKGKEEV